MNTDPHHRWHVTWLGSDRPLARRLARPVARFLHIEAAGGVLLLMGAALAMAWANSPWADAYHHLWTTLVGLRVGGFTIELTVHEWINDAAMALFFFVVGLEIKREMVSGELRDPRAAALPVVSALGGMVVPAVIFAVVNVGGAGARGWGIPMATDIAFAVGVVSLLGRRVPGPLKLFLLTLAVADDLGAILVIAVAYSTGVQAWWLAVAAATFAVIVMLRRAGVWFFPVYALCGVVAWYAMFRSGVHATVAGVVLGFLTPHRPLREGLPAEPIAERWGERGLSAADVRNVAFHMKESVPVDVRLVDLLHPWTGYLIVPLFALANAGVPLSGEALSRAVTSPVTLGVLLGLVVGKTVGVLGAALLSSRLGLTRLPAGVTPQHLLGISLAAGIGFTVAIFVTGLSLDEPALQDEAKIGIFAASLIAAGLSAACLATAERRSRPGRRADVGLVPVERQRAMVR